MDRRPATLGGNSRQRVLGLAIMAAFLTVWREWIGVRD